MLGSRTRLRIAALAAAVATPLGLATLPASADDYKMNTWVAAPVPAIGDGFVCAGLIQAQGWTFEGPTGLPDGSVSEPHIGYAQVWYQGPEVPIRPCRIAVRVIWRNLDTGASGEQVAWVNETMTGTSTANVFFYPGVGRTEIGITTFGPNKFSIVNTFTP